MTNLPLEVHTDFIMVPSSLLTVVALVVGVIIGVMATLIIVKRK